MITYFSLSENAEYSLKDISQFNDFCFPIRKPHHEYDVFRFVDNPFADKIYNHIYSVVKDGKYIAQMLTMPAPLSLDGKTIPAYWGQDYFVLEDFRGEGIGKELSKLYLSRNYYIAVGFSPKSAVIHQKMGARKIGYLDFFMKWASPLHKLKFLFNRGLKIKQKKISSYRFPDSVSGFNRIYNVEELHLPEMNWNPGVIETLRDKTYFEWRFFYKPDRYFVYQSREKSFKNSPYFVVKPYFFKGVNWLRIVDFRFENSNPEQFEEILQSVEHLRKQLGLYGVLVPSSQKLSNDILFDKNFQRFKHEVVLTTYPFTHAESDETHDYFICSFADSDMDMHSNLGKFNYGEDY